MIKGLKASLIYIKNHKILWPIILFGWLVGMSLYLPISNSMGHDFFWHLSLIKISFKTWPPSLPIMAGQTLQGYNWLLDFLIYLVSKIGFSPEVIYAVVFPIFYLVSMTILSISLALKQKKTHSYILFFLFFVFFASPFSYILSFIKRGSIFFGFSYPTAMQSVTTLTNLQHAATILLIMTVLIIFENKKITIKNEVVISLLVFLAFGFKFYGGVILGFLVFLYFLSDFIQKRKIFTLIKSSFFLLLAGVISLLIFYDPLSSGKSDSVFAFYPLSTVHPIIEDPGAFYMPNLVLARYYLLEHNIFSPRLWLIELFTIVIYIVYNTGTRIIGFLYLIKSAFFKKISKFETIIFITAVFSFLLSITFIQKGGDWWNTVQFFGYSLFLLNFFAASAVEKIWQLKSKLKFLVILLIITLTLPLGIELLILQQQRTKIQSELTKKERQALDFLKTEPYGIVQNFPISKSAYISAFTEKPLYFADEQVLKNLGVDYQKRKNELEDILNINIAKMPIEYFYIKKLEPDYSLINEKISNEKESKKIFENQEIVIYSKN